MAKNTGKEFETFTKALFEAIHSGAGITGVEILHDDTLPGNKIGDGKVNEHKIDLWWSFKQGGFEQRYVVECKDRGRAVEMSYVATLVGVLGNLPGCRGIMVSRLGFQDGARTFAAAHGIELYALNTEGAPVLTHIKTGTALPLGIEVVPTDWDWGPETALSPDEERRKQDKAIFAGHDALLPEEDLRKLLNLIGTDEPFPAELLERCRRLPLRIQDASNSFIDNERQAAAKAFADVLWPLWRHVDLLQKRLETGRVPQGMASAAHRNLRVRNYERNDQQGAYVRHNGELETFVAPVLPAYEAYRLLIRKTLFV